MELSLWTMSKRFPVLSSKSAGTRHDVDSARASVSEVQSMSRLIESQPQARIITCSWKSFDRARIKMRVESTTKRSVKFDRENGIPRQTDAELAAAAASHSTF